MEPRRNWTEEEVREALALYLRTPFGRMHSKNSEIVTLARRLGRTPSAVALKLTNLAALDESLPRRGMANASKTDRRVWSEFLVDPEKVESLFRTQTNGSRVDSHGFAESPESFGYAGSDIAAVGRRRQGQGLFREIILTNYRQKCALTGIDDRRLLTASHIVGWSERAETRMLPSNGICLNALHDRAFDRHLITFDDDLRLIISPKLSFETQRQLYDTASAKLALPERFLPDPALLAEHRSKFEAMIQ